MKLNRNLYLIILVLLGALSFGSAHACSPIKGFGVYFEKNSAAVSAEQVGRMAEWIIKLKERYRRYDFIDLIGTSEPGEAVPEKLGLERARNVMRVLSVNLEFDTKKIHLPARGYVAAPVSENMKKYDKSQGVRGVDISFLPGCPHECSCQVGDFVEMP